MHDEFARVLREARLSSNYPRTEDFAERTGISVRGVATLETGVRMPTKETLNRITRCGIISEAHTYRLRRLWLAQQAESIGLSVYNTTGLNVERLARLIATEVELILCRASVRFPSSVMVPLKNRVLTILKTKLEQ